MLRPTFLIAVALGFIVASAPSARADMCFRYQKSGGGILVAKGKFPLADNTCQPLALYEVGGGGLEGSATGSICQDWAGATVVFHYTYDACMALDGDSYHESATCRLQLASGPSLPTTNSDCRGTYIKGTTVATFHNDGDAVLEPCDGNNVDLRVPNDMISLCLKEPGFSHKSVGQQ